MWLLYVGDRGSECLLVQRPFVSYSKNFRVVCSRADENMPGVWNQNFSWVGTSGNSPSQCYKQNQSSGEMYGGFRLRKRQKEFAENLVAISFIKEPTPESMKNGMGRFWFWQYKGLILKKGSVSSKTAKQRLLDKFIFKNFITAEEEVKKVS